MSGTARTDSVSTPAAWALAGRLAVGLLALEACRFLRPLPLGVLRTPAQMAQPFAVA